MVVLLPRLPAPAAEAVIRRYLDYDAENWPRFIARQLPGVVRFAATGGNRIPDSELLRLRERIEVLARKHGFGSGRDAFARFDAETAAWLGQEPVFASGEALRDDVWSFVGAVLAPDIVHWRFGTAHERYLGGNRNTFQRLWMRGRVLDRGTDHQNRWQILDELTEDAFVQITERPSIGGDPVLALAIGEAWLRAAKHHGKPAMEPLMRRAVLRIRIKNEIRSLAHLPVQELANLLDQAFATPSNEPKITDGAASTEPIERPINPTIRISSGGTGPNAPPREAVRRIGIEAERRGWLSPKSRSAFDKLQFGNAIGTSERNALEYLFKRMLDGGILTAEIHQVSIAISLSLPSIPLLTSELPRPLSSK